MHLTFYTTVIFHILSYNYFFVFTVIHVDVAMGAGATQGRELENFGGFLARGIVRRTAQFISYYLYALYTPESAEIISLNYIKYK